MSQGLFAALYGQGRPFALIDTRERRDHVNGHWFGSINIPLSGLTDDIARMIPDREFPLHLLDWQDAASAAAADRLSQLGYDQVTLCPTALPDAFGHGFVKGEYVWSKAFGEVVAHECGLPELTPADYLAHHADAMLFDVRPTAEYRQFTIPGSQSLPNSLLLANMAALTETGSMALLHCAGRTRSIIGACTLKAAGYDGPFAIFRGGTQAWQLDGYEREHQADRLFATEQDSRDEVHAFLARWDIPFEAVGDEGLAAFVAAHKSSHLFDVSDDAATGQRLTPGIIRISGTNLIQQTDRSIARYHVPVILFDHGSGSRAAFAAYWLKLMGFAVCVVYLDSRLSVAAPEAGVNQAIAVTSVVLSGEALMAHQDNGGDIFDFRPSQHYRCGHLRGSVWQNIGGVLADETSLAPPANPAAIIGRNVEHAAEVAAMLEPHDWPISGLYGWDRDDLDGASIDQGKLDNPADESNLFAGRHYGNMQDSRDYLAWEEELPGQIDRPLHDLWHRLLTAAFQTWR